MIIRTVSLVERRAFGSQTLFSGSATLPYHKPLRCVLTRSVVEALAGASGLSGRAVNKRSAIVRGLCESSQTFRSDPVLNPHNVQSALISPVSAIGFPVL